MYDMTSRDDVVMIRKKLDKMCASGSLDASIVEELLQVLGGFPMTVDVLKQSKIGLTLNSIRKNHKNTKIGLLAKDLRERWMKIWDNDAALKKKAVGSNATGGITSNLSIEQEEFGPVGDVTNECGVLVVLKAMMCLTQRARFDVTVSTENLELSGKSVQFKIPLATIQNIFLLPDSNNTQCYFMIELNDPVKRGKTEYKMFVFTLSKKISLTQEMFMNQTELDIRYSGRLKRHLSGLETDVISTIIQAVTNKKLITIDSCQMLGTKNRYISCSLKSDSGLLYPLENSFVFLPKPSLHIKFDDIHSIEFDRGDGYNRTFDLIIKTSSRKLIHFSIEKEKYEFIQSFLQQKDLIRTSRQV